MKKRKLREAKVAAAAAAAVQASSEAAGSAAAPRMRKRKRRRTEKPPPEPEVEEEDEDEEENEDGALDGEQPEIEMEFDFREPDEADYHAVKDLVHSSATWEFVGDALNFSELADSVVGQGNIGTIIKSNIDTEEEASCGLLTVLNMRQFAKTSWPKVVQNALLAQAAKHGGPEVTTSLKDVLGRQGKGTEVGLLLSERFVNLPEELVPPLHKALKEDMEWSCTTPDCPKEERPFYFFTHLIGVAKCFLTAGRASAAGLAVEKADGPFFQLDEMEAYMKKASWSFTMPMRPSGEKSNAAISTKKKKGGDPPGPDGRAVFMISRKALDHVVKELGRKTAS